MKNALKVFMMVVSLVALNSCSSSSSSDSTTSDTTTSDTTTNTAAAITAMFSGTGGSSSVSEQSLLIKIQEVLIKLAHAQEDDTGQSDNCDEEAGASDDVTVGQDGDAGTYGPEGDSITVAEADFCANGGTYSTYEISSSDPVTFDCDGDSFVMIGGSGVWDSDLDTGTTEVAGSFTVAEDTSGTNSAEVDCHGNITSEDEDTATFDMNCTDSDGNALTLAEDVTCTQS